jgi:thermitase
MWLVRIAALSLSLALPATVSAAFLDHPYVPGELVVGFREGTPRAAEDAVHARVGATVVRRSPSGRATLVRFAAAGALESRHAEYVVDPAVEYAEPNYLGKGGFTPDDTWFGDQWHHANTGQFGGTAGADIESEAGWDLMSPDPGIVVAVLDTGIDSDHPEFAGRIVAGFDFINSDADPEDDHGHGTLVTGLLAANSDNAFAVAGVNSACRIQPVKVLDANNAGNTFALAAGVDFARLNGADVISMSLIDYPFSTAVNQALAAARQAGAILVACAGNGGIGDADVSQPGASTQTISIGATDLNDDRAWYSGTGTSLDYVAPGDGVYTVAFDTSADVDQWFAGCSAATPVAAGIVSLLKSLDPGLVTREVRTLLTAGAEDLVGLPAEDTPGRDDYMGNGRLNLRAVIQAYLNAVAVPEAEAIAAGLELSVRPTPTAGPVRISFRLPGADRVVAALYDVSGRRVRTLGRGVRPAGPVEITWDGRDEAGAPVAAGVYFVRVESRHVTETRTVVVAR